MDKADQKWIDEQEAIMLNGTKIVMDASNEALDYLSDAINNIDDVQWRKMTVSTQAVEMGIGIAIAEQLIPDIFRDMEKTMHKKLKIPKHTSQSLRHIYLGRVMKNIIKELHERDK